MSAVIKKENKMCLQLYIHEQISVHGRRSNKIIPKDGPNVKEDQYMSQSSKVTNGIGGQEEKWEDLRKLIRNNKMIFNLS